MKDRHATVREWDWFDKPKNRRLLWIILWALCIASVVGEFFVERESHFAADDYFGAYALIGFAACAGAIFVSKVLGWFLKVKEDYYDDV